MQTTAFMPFRHMGKPVGGFKLKIFKQRGYHCYRLIDSKNRRILPESAAPRHEISPVTLNAGKLFFSGLFAPVQCFIKVLGRFSGENLNEFNAMKMRFYHFFR